MFDINKADAKQKAIYARLSVVDKIMVDEGIDNIDDHAGVLSKVAANKKPSLDSKTNRAGASARPDFDNVKSDTVSTEKRDYEGFGLKDIAGLFSGEQANAMRQAAAGVGSEFVAQAGRYGDQELVGDIVRLPETVPNMQAGILESLVNPVARTVTKALDLQDPTASGEQEDFLKLPRVDLGLKDRATEVNDAIAGSDYGKWADKTIYTPAQGAADKLQSNVEAYKEANNIGSGFDGGARGIALDVAGNPDQVAGLAGGIINKIPTPVTQAVAQGLISIPVSRVYLNEYNAAITAGVDKDTAKARALQMAGIEYATELAGGKLGVGKAADELVTSSTRKVAQAMGSESLEEVGAELAGGGLDTYTAATAKDGSAEKTFAEAHAFKSVEDAFERAAYAGTVGAVSGGIARTATAPFETRAEKNQAAFLAGKYTNERLAKLNAENEGKAPVAPAAAVPDIEATVGLSVTPKPSPATVTKTQQEDLAYAQKAEQDAKVADAKATQLEVSATEDTNKKTLAEAGVAIAESGKQGTMVNPEVATEAELSEAKKLKQEAQKKKAIKENADFNKADKNWKANQTRTAKKLAAEAVEQDLPESHIALGMRKWNEENPRPQKPKSKVSLASTEEDISDAEVDDIASQMKSGTSTVAPKATTVADSATAVPNQVGKPAAKTKVTAAERPAVEETFRKQFKAMAPKDINAAVKAIEAGNLVVAKTGTTMGNGDPLPADSKGHYDGKTMWVNQDSLDNGKSLKDVAEHEVEHFFRLATPKDHENVKGMFVGRENLAKDVADIEKLAANGNKVAQAAVASAKRAGPDVYNLELPAYFIEHSSKAVREGGILGSARQTYNDIKSALKEKIVGEVTSIAENPSRVSRKRLENTQAAMQPGENNTGAESLQSFAGENATGFKQAKAEGRTFRGPDGKERFFVNDGSAKANQKYIKDLPVNTEVPLTDVFNNPELLKEYPWLEDVIFEKASIKKLNPQGGAAVQGRADVYGFKIMISEAVANNPIQLGSIIMHEIQHFIQTQEGFVPGSSVNNHYDFAKAELLWEDLAEALVEPALSGELLQTVAEQAGYGDIKEMEGDKENWTPEQRQRYNSARGVVRTAEGVAKYPAVLESGSLEAVPQLRKFMIKYARELSQDGLLAYDVDTDKKTPWVKEELQALADLRMEAVQTYRNVVGEKEARLTQRLWEIAQKGGVVSDPVGDFSTEMDNGDLVIIDPMFLSDPLLEKFGMPARESKRRVTSLQSKDEDVTETPEFQAFFEGSEAVDEDGNPQRYYTGTSKDKNFTSFNIPKNGAWFTNDPKVASDYAKENDSQKSVYENGRFVPVHTSSRVIPVYLQTGRVYRITGPDLLEMNKDNYRKSQGVIFDRLRAQGYDSVIMSSEGNDTIVIIGNAGQIKSAVGNKGTFDPKKKDFLQSKDDAPVPSTSRSSGLDRAATVMKGIFGQLSSQGVTGPKLRELIERMKSAPTEYALVAEAALNDLSSEMVAAESVDPNFGTQEFIDRVESTKDAAERERILNAAAREHPEFIRAYRFFRDSIDKFSDAIVEERAKMLDTHPLTKKEAALYKAILDNKGTYTTRQYLINYGRKGEIFGERTWKGFERTAANPDKATAEERQSFVRVANALVYLRGALVIPEILPDSKKRLTDLYTSWFAPEDGDTVDSMTRALEDARSRIDQEQIDNASKAIVRQILGVDTKAAGMLAARVRGESRDNSIITARNDVPKALRELMGEVTDSPLKMMLTLTAQANFVARTQMLAELSQNPDWVVSAADRHKKGNEKFSEPLTGAEWGPLEGMYTKPDVMNLIKTTVVPDVRWSHISQLAIAGHPKESAKMLGSKVLSTWGTGSNVTKAMLVMGNPFNYIWNLLGNPLNVMRQGNFNQAKYGPMAWTVVKELISSKSLRSVSDLTREVQRMGVTDSAQIGELTADKLQLLEDLVHKSTNTTEFDKALRKLRGGVATAREVYAMTDVISKISNYLYYRDQLMEFRDYEAAGNKETGKVTKIMSDEDVRRKAADRVSNDNITFKRAMPAAKVLESSGLTLFAPYISEAFRTQFNNVANGLEEVNEGLAATTPQGRKKMFEIAARRLAGTMISGAILTAGIAALASAGEDEKDKAIKAFLPDYAQYGAPMQVGVDPDGNPLYVTLNRADPWGPLTDIYRAAETGNIEDARDAKKAVLDLYVKPRLGYKAYDWLTKEFGDEATSYDKAKARKNLAAAFVPSWASNASSTDTPGGLGKSDYPVGTSGRALLGDMVKVLGGRLETANVKKTTGFAAKAFQDAQKLGRKEVYQTLANEPDLSTKDFASMLQDYRETEQKKFKDLVDMDKALVAMGKRPQDRREIWKAAGLNKTVIELVLKGKNPSTFTTLLSKDSMNKSWEYEAGRSSEEDSEKAKANIKKNAAKLEPLGYKFN